MATVAPAIGRIVHYVSRGSADGRYPPACRVGITTAILGGPYSVISAAVLTPTGLFFHEHLPYSAAGLDGGGGTWHWPERTIEGLSALQDLEGVLLIRPDERLIVRVRPEITMERLDELTTQLANTMPGAVLIVADQLAAIPAEQLDISEHSQPPGTQHLPTQDPSGQDPSA